MNKWIKIISALFILGIVGGVLGYYFIYNKPHVDYEKAEAEYRFTGEQLHSLYVANSSEASQKYNGSVLAVTGRISSVENPDSLTVIVFALSEGMFGDEGIRFTMLEHYRDQANALGKDELVTIKGYCTGYNDTDVILEKCSIIK